jgi:protein-S-isoprenylcysteine O-methyltransferase Ste14
MNPRGSVRKWAVKTAIYVLLLALLLLLVSGSADWTAAWAYLALVTVVTALSGIVLARVSPGLLAERSQLQAGTKPWDKLLAPLVGLVGPLAIYVTAALDYRHQWSRPQPLWLTMAAFIVAATGALAATWAMAANRFFSTTVRIQKERGHRVVDAGPYRIVRHPGYASVIAIDLAMPLALGSLWALIPGVATCALLVVRTALEDRTLRAELDGYSDYAARVRYRLAPGVW